MATVPRRHYTLAYNTNGFAHHRLEDALFVLRRLGYRGVALTLDVQHLDPLTTGRAELDRVRGRLDELGLSVVVETGARFVLDARRKHFPTLLTPRRWRERFDFLVAGLDTARALGAGVVSFWSGAATPGQDAGATMKRLAERCRALADEAAARDVCLGFEPEPGMFVDRMAGYSELAARVDHPAFKLTLDLGHLHCQGEVPIAKQLAAFATDLVHVHMEDMVQGVHAHLPFGEGEIDFRPVARMLDRIDYRGQVAVELSRESHRAVDAARDAIDYWKRVAGQRPRR